MKIILDKSNQCFFKQKIIFLIKIRYNGHVGSVDSFFEILGLIFLTGSRSRSPTILEMSPRLIRKALECVNLNQYVR